MTPFSRWTSLIKTYCQLTKPGIVSGNLITASGGFAVAARGQIDPRLLFETLIGVAFIVASACVFNNYLDRHRDEKMARTRHRAFVKQSVSVRTALAFAVLLGLSGVATLATCANLLAVLSALIGLFVYLILYTFLKSRSVYGTEVGSIAGGIPPVIGYCAVSNHLDLGAILLFLILVLWQMPHFFAISLYRIDEFAAASLPVLPIQGGIQKTKIRMLIYVIAFLVAAPTLTLFGYTGYWYLISASLVGSVWLWLCVHGFNGQNERIWARKMFLASLQVIAWLSVVMFIDVRQPC